MMTIVLAWFDDANQRQAAIWNANGSSDDYNTALREARGTGRRVYTYATTEADPLGRARRDLADDQRYNSANLRRWSPLASIT